ncbi:MAG TPA: hypothetical protein ENG33_04360 [Chloroflexi bacterium]|nr:hypothetical protein [Chloroflexota bacterium]
MPNPLRSIPFVLLILVMVSCNPNTPPLTPLPHTTPSLSEYELAYYYAPVIYQGAASDQDYITAVDFDGDWIGNNNWENQPIGDLSAYVYYSVVETETHWFIFYSLFHPRDYTAEHCEKSRGCHENDMESIQLAVFKDGSRYGRLQAMETLAHGDIYLYTADPTVKAGYLRIFGPVQFEGEHPIIYVEPYGHGIHGHPIALGPWKVVYRVGEEAQIPEDVNDSHVTYRLISIYETLWAHRDEVGQGRAFDRLFNYRGSNLPATLDGDNYKSDRANTPWGYSQAIGKVLRRGDWFLDPARAFAYHATFEGEFSTRYLYNPYLADLGLP